MKLLPLDGPELIERVAGWLSRKENHQWLDFGNGRQAFTPALLKVMAQRESHFLRVFTSDRGEEPVGLVALNSVDRGFRTATFWGLTGEKSFRNWGYSTYAASRFLSLAFRELGLNAINTWVADGNPSLRIIERLGFRYIGRQRQCHYIDGQPRDRLMFDLLASEFQEVHEKRPQRADGRNSETAGEKRDTQAA